METTRQLNQSGGQGRRRAVPGQRQILAGGRALRVV
jgi:hypothetical protein